MVIGMGDYRMKIAMKHYLCGVLRVLLALAAVPATAQISGVTTQGSSGGMVIPAAQVLSEGSVALTYGNYQEPQLGSFATQQNFSLGLGLLPGVELFGRLTNYTTPVAGSAVDSGLRDLSANLKVRLPDFWKGGPRIAVGINDVSGGAVNFKSGYVVASQEWGPWSSSLGVATGSSASKKAFNGAFGGVYWRALDTGLTLMAEHDSQQPHVGARWESQPIAALGRAQWIGTVQRSLGSVPVTDGDQNATRAAMTLLIPFGENRARIASFQPAAAKELPEIEPGEGTSPQPSASRDAMRRLHAKLVGVGLERVRVGTHSSALGNVLTVQYENHRYAHNEVDALGIVFGLASELAPAGTQRVQAVTLKEGLPVYETSIGVGDYRQFLRDGAVGPLRNGLVWTPGAQVVSSQTDWADGDSDISAFSRIRVEIKPDFNYALGTEVGVLDYALAANVEVTAPLWRGAVLHGGYTVPVGHTSNVDSGYAFSLLRQKPGLRTLALGNSLWLGRQFLTRVDVGRFHYDVNGIQAEGTFIFPISGNLVRLRGAAYNQAPGGIAGDDRAASASYRHNLGANGWLEGGLQRYSDNTYGPSLEWVRWFGDFRVQVFYRRGADVKFAGLQLSIPLTPRQGMQPGGAVLSGASQYGLGIRTRLTSADQPANLVQPWAVQDLKLERSQDVDFFNAGRMSQPYMQSQLDRMREAFYLYGRSALP